MTREIVNRIGMEAGVELAILAVAVQSIIMTEIPETDGHRMEAGLDQDPSVEVAAEAVVEIETMTGHFTNTAMLMTIESPEQGVGNTMETTVHQDMSMAIAITAGIEGNGTGTIQTRAMGAKAAIAAQIGTGTERKHPAEAIL